MSQPEFPGSAAYVLVTVTATVTVTPTVAVTVLRLSSGPAH